MFQLGLFPKIENELLNQLQQPLPHDGIRETFIDNQQNRFQQAVSSWLVRNIFRLII